MSAPLLDPSFKWIPSASHDADSTPFRERQMARIKKANEERARAAAERKEVVWEIKWGAK
jgi:hypothetical protein